MDISTLLDVVKNTEDCIVQPASGRPSIGPSHLLPSDVEEFYRLCGGVVLFQSIAFPLTILPPQRVALANAVITCSSEAELLAGGLMDADDISWSWYTIAEDGNGDYFTIDLSPDRAGRCYDSCHETHAQPGDTPVVAQSFTEFVVRMRNLILESSRRRDRDSRWHWRDMVGKLTLGDAYD
jgi:hypothetical protein